MSAQKPEAKFKGHICTQVKADGGYARRIEDQFAVGVPDMVLIPKGGPVFFAEAKIIRGTWGPTPRQKLELDRIRDTGGAVPLMLGLWERTGTIILSDADRSTDIVCNHHKDITRALREFQAYWESKYNAR